MNNIFDKTVNCAVEIKPEDHKILKTAALRLDTSLKALMSDAMHMAAKRLHRIELEQKRDEVFLAFAKDAARYRNLEGQYKPGSKKVDSETLSQ